MAYQSHTLNGENLKEHKLFQRLNKQTILSIEKTRLPTITTLSVSISSLLIQTHVRDVTKLEAESTTNGKH